jgi:hypothetical protein
MCRGVNSVPRRTRGPSPRAGRGCRRGLPLEVPCASGMPKECQPNCWGFDVSRGKVCAVPAKCDGLCPATLGSGFPRSPSGALSYFIDRSCITTGPLWTRDRTTGAIGPIAGSILQPIRGCPMPADAALAKRLFVSQVKKNKRLSCSSEPDPSVPRWHSVRARRTDARC